MKSVEERIKVIEGMVAEIHAVLVLGREPAPPDLEVYKRAIEAMTEGDMAPMRLYLRRGGQVPKTETIYPDAAAILKDGYRAPRRRPANQSAAATTRKDGRSIRIVPSTPGPVMLPAKERGASSVSSTTNL